MGNCVATELFWGFRAKVLRRSEDGAYWTGSLLSPVKLVCFEKSLTASFCSLISHLRYLFLRSGGGSSLDESLRSSSSGDLGLGLGWRDGSGNRLAASPLSERGSPYPSLSRPSGSRS